MKKQNAIAGLAGLVMLASGPNLAAQEQGQEQSNLGSQSSIETQLDADFIESTTFGRLYEATIDTIKAHAQEEALLVSYDESEQVPVQSFYKDGTEITYALEDSLVERGWSQMIEAFNTFTDAGFDTSDYETFHSYLKSVEEEYGSGMISFGNIENPNLNYMLDLGSHIERLESYEGEPAEQNHVQLLRVGARNDEQTGILYTISGSEPADEYGAGRHGLLPDQIQVNVISGGEMQDEFYLSDASPEVQQEHMQEVYSILQTLNSNLTQGNDEETTYSVEPASMNQPMQESNIDEADAQETMYELENGVRAYDLGETVRLEIPNPEHAQSGVLAYRGTTLQSEYGSLYESVEALDNGNTYALSMVDGKGDDEVVRDGMTYQAFTFDKENLESQMDGNTLRHIPSTSNDGRRQLGNNPRGHVLEHMNFEVPEELYKTE